MEEPEVFHPFSSDFRSQLSEVLSKPGIKTKPALDDKEYLETEIDSYSGVQFDNSAKTNSTKRPPTPPKPVNRAFTFDKTNPFTRNSNDANKLSLPKYAEVNKTKRRPEIPPKPKARTEVATNTLPHAQKLPDEIVKISKEDYFFRVNSLPNLTPEITQCKNVRASGNFLLVEEKNSTPGYGHLNRTRQIDESVYHLADTSTDYCDVIPESPAYGNESSGSRLNENRYENIYEDVNTKGGAAGESRSSPSETHGSESDYTLMSSPVSGVQFTFGRQSLYENCTMIHSPDSVFSPSESDVDSPKFVVGDPNRVGLPGQVPGNRVAKDLVSPTSTSSCDDQDSSVYSVQSSMASTTASSFQRVEVCYFPPSPPPEYRDRPGSSASSSSTRSRSSRSRIPVPIKPKSPLKPTTPEIVEPQLPPTPTPSPAARSKKGSKQAKPIELSPPSPPGTELVPVTGKGLARGSKPARWYEKLGCIQTDTMRPSEPYGLPGERKRSKSLNREQRKSQFFLPVEPNASEPPPNAPQCV